MGKPIRLRIEGTRQECADGLAALRRVLHVTGESPYLPMRRDRSGEGRIFFSAEVPDGPVQATATRCPAAGEAATGQRALGDVQAHLDWSRRAQ